jgi:hypothetical protein
MNVSPASPVFSPLIYLPLDHIDLPITIPPRPELSFRQLQEWLPHKSTSYIIHRRRQLRISHFFLDGLEGFGDGCGIGYVGGDGYGVAAGCFDLIEDGFRVGDGPGEEDDGVGVGEFEGYGAAWEGQC